MSKFMHTITKWPLKVVHIFILIGFIFNSTRVVGYSGVSTAALKAAVSQIADAGANTGWMAKMSSICGPYDPWACAAAAATAVQIGMLVANAAASNDTASKASNLDAAAYGLGVGKYKKNIPGGIGGTGTSDGGGYTGDINGNGDDKIEKQTKTIDEQIKNIQKQLGIAQRELAAKGYSATPDGKIRLPDGSKIDASLLGSSQGLQSLGMSASAAQAFLADRDKTLDKGRKEMNSLLASNGGGEGGGDVGGIGGGGGGRGAKGKAGDKAGLNGPLFNLKDLFGNKDKSKGGKFNPAAAGLSIKLGDDNIGVAGDNIFLMVSRQYLRGVENRDFLPPTISSSPISPPTVPGFAPRGPVRRKP